MLTTVPPDAAKAIYSWCDIAVESSQWSDVEGAECGAMLLRGDVRGHVYMAILLRVQNNLCNNTSAYEKF
jgi:hypothetical protein